MFIIGKEISRIFLIMMFLLWMNPTRYSALRKKVILNFVNNGGGFKVSDHSGSYRDGDGRDSPAIRKDLITNNTIQTNPFGFTADLVNFSNIISNVLTNSSSSPVLTCSQGIVFQMEFNNGTTATVTNSNPNAKDLIRKYAVPKKLQ